MLSSNFAAWLALAGHAPLLQALVIILATFVLEDAATVLAAMQVADGSLSVGVALGALYVGIVLGDLGLYGLGVAASRIGFIARRLPPRRTDMVRGWIAGRVFKVVLISRFLPGLRLPTYTTCGYVRADLRAFTLATVLATAVWTSGLFTLSLYVGEWLTAYFGAWRWLGAGGFVLALIVLGRIAAARPRSMANHGGTP